MSKQNHALQFIAHRGYQMHYPENTLLAMEKALAVGAKNLELDIQFTADGHPVLYHDKDLTRLSGENGHIAQLSLAQALNTPSFEPERLGSAFESQKIASLAQMVELLSRHRDVTCFVEIKRACLEHRTTADILARLASTLEPVIDQCVLISFSFDIIVEARAMGWNRLGAVLIEWRQLHEEAMLNLRPEVIFCDVLKLPETGSIKLPVGKLAVYEVQDPQLAQTLLQRGATLIETFAIGEMLGSI